MNKKQQTRDEGQAKPAPAAKTSVEDLQPRAESGIRGGKVAQHDIPIITHT